MPRLGRAQPFPPLTQRRRPAFVPLSGTVPAVSTLNANLYVTWALSGQIDAVAALSGSLYRTRELSGQIDAVSVLVANLYLTWGLSGTIGITCYLVANLEIISPERLPIGKAIGPETITAISRTVEGLAAQGLIAAPVLPGQGGINVVIPEGDGIIGAIALVNLDENPSFEVNTTGVLAIQGSFAQSNAKAKYGSYSLLAEQTTWPMLVYKRRQDLSWQPVVEGESYVHSASLQMSSGEAQVGMVINWLDVENNLISAVSALDDITDSAWVEIEVKGIAPAGAIWVWPSIFTWTGFSNGEAVHIDGQEFRHASTYNLPYIDGDQDGCHWIGTPHASASKKISIAPQKGRARDERTVEGRARTDRPLPSGKAV